MNFLQGQVHGEDGQVHVVVSDHRLTPSAEMQPVLRGYDGRPIMVGIRAENMETLAQPIADALPVRVLVVEPLGSQNLLTIRIGPDTVKVSTHPTFTVQPNMDVWLRFPAEKIRWVDHENGQVLYPRSPI